MSERAPHQQLIDTHCHLDFEVFDNDRDEVVGRARQAGISNIIIPATVRKGWGKISALCDEYGFHACFGLHPYWTEEHVSNDLDALLDIVEDESCVGIGECGLDFRQGQPDKEKQITLFERQLAVAAEYDLPVTIHAVNSTEEVIRSIKKFKPLTGKMHSYSGSYEQALQLIELGFFISYGGTITYDYATKQRHNARMLPLEYLMIETNSPDQPDVNHKDLRNEPAYIIEIINSLAEIRKTSIEDIVNETTHNAKRLFGI